MGVHAAHGGDDGELRPATVSPAFRGVEKRAGADVFGPRQPTKGGKLQSIRMVDLVPAAPPPVRLGIFPTPVERVRALEAGGGELWVKRDDLSAEPYGGSKVRKLEYLFAEARRRGKRKILTVGAAGSHHVLATTVHGRREGFDVGALLLPQPGTAHVEANLRADLAQGARIIPTSMLTLPLRAWLAMDDDTYFVTVGGSSVVGSMGYVGAALELAAQIEGGALPVPDVITVALGSGGTAAGLAVGLARAGLHTKVVGVAVGKPVFVLGMAARRLVRGVARACRVSARAALDHLVIDGRWVGRGYGHATGPATEAIARAASAGLVLDATYTGKAFAATLARIDDGASCGRPERILFWHTLSSRPIEPLLALPPGGGSGAGEHSELPPAVRRLLV
jgi:1-aminocyclopropane-1-carboxylate deaminase/D-cysteine desulfhydrase-like pyridoxal-dependent ACC family enzyme